MSLNIGIDLCDDYITAYCHEEKSMLSVPAVICRDKKEDLWYIGETAYRTALKGSGVLTDKLISLLRKKGTSTVARRAYTAEQLIAKLLGTVILRMLNEADFGEIGRLVIAVRNADKEEMDGVLSAAVMAGIEKDKVSVISHQEAFVHYMSVQEKELSYNMVGLFDLSGEELSFYRMKVVRGAGRNSIVAEGEDLEETFRIGILKNESGSELADRIMKDAAVRCLGNDIYSAVLLTGKGFERTDWARNFVDYICRKRRVMYEAGLFAIGAAVYAAEGPENAAKSTAIYCDTRTGAEVSLGVIINEKKSKLIMIPAGVPWHDISTYAEVLPKGQDFIDIDIEPVDRFKSKRSVRIRLDGFPKRPDRCTRVSVEMRFRDSRELEITVRDLGFGEIYRASGAAVSETVSI